MTGGPGRPPDRLLLHRGAGALRRLPDLLRSDTSRRVLLVTGRRSFEASGAASLEAALEHVGPVRRWADVTPNPSADDIDGLVAIAASHRPDLVVGVGGGSVLDAAKAAAALLDATDTAGVAERIRSGTAIRDRRVGLVLVPTTAGSGAEATPFATVYVDGVKHSLAGPALRADRVVLDPMLLGGASITQRATSGFDAVAQAIESLWAVGADEGSRRDARWALALLLPAIRGFVAGDGDPGAARRMLLGSHLAGRAIAVSRTTAAHALSYALTTDLGLPHGRAVGTTLPALLRINADAPDEDLRVSPSTHRRAMREVLAALGVEDGAEGEARLVALLQDIGLRPLPPATAGAIRTRAAELALRANAERLGNDPVRLDTARLIEVLAAGSN